jgi:hypothetical protein
MGEPARLGTAAAQPATGPTTSGIDTATAARAAAPMGTSTSPAATNATAVGRTTSAAAPPRPPLVPERADHHPLGGCRTVVPAWPGGIGRQATDSARQHRCSPGGLDDHRPSHDGGSRRRRGQQLPTRRRRPEWLHRRTGRPRPLARLEPRPQHRCAERRPTHTATTSAGVEGLPTDRRPTSASTSIASPTSTTGLATWWSATTPCTACPAAGRVPAPIMTASGGPSITAEPHPAPMYATRQIRRLMVYVHEVLLSAVGAAQVSSRVEPVPENPSGDGWWTATRTARKAGSDPRLT